MGFWVWNRRSRGSERYSARWGYGLKRNGDDWVGMGAVVLAKVLQMF